jgi:riboflavin kinase/FMN adenylyltransferase
VSAAAAAIGRPHRIEGVVVHGDHRGRELGFPTANIASAAWAALPADGVYAGHFVLGERRLPSAISVGTNPTFSGRERTVEVYVLDVDEDFYGFDVGVDIEHWLRGQERFTDIDALLVQIRADVDRTRALLGS